MLCACSIRFYLMVKTKVFNEYKDCLTCLLSFVSPYFPNPNIFIRHCLYHHDKINTLPSTCCLKTSTKRMIIPISDYYTSSEDISIDLLEQFSDTFYPNLYCGCVEASEKACYEQNILELWGDQVHTYDIIHMYKHNKFYRQILSWKIL